MDEALAAAWREWFRGYMANYRYDVAGDAVKAAFLAGAEWAQRQQEATVSEAKDCPLCDLYRC